MLVCTTTVLLDLASLNVDGSARYLEKLRKPNETDAFSRGASQSLKLGDEPKVEVTRIQDSLVYELCMIMCESYLAGSRSRLKQLCYMWKRCAVKTKLKPSMFSRSALQFRTCKRLNLGVIRFLRCCI